MQPLSSVTPPSFVVPTKSVNSARPVTHEAVSTPTDQAQLSTPAPSPAPAPKAQAAPAAPEAPKVAAPPPPPTTLQMIEPDESQEDMLKFVLDAAGDCSMKNHPKLDDIRQRLPQMPAPIAQAGVDPLMDALTTTDPQEASQKLDNFHDTLTWARKFKSDARGVMEQGGDWAALEAAALKGREARVKPETSLDRSISSPGFLKAHPLSHKQEVEGARLIDQFEAGNTNPGLGTKTLGKGICYLRGREGTRIFYRMQDDKPQYLAVCNKSSEDSVISLLRREFDLR